MRGLLGLAALLAIAWALSEDRRRIPWRTVIAGIALQWALALLLLYFPPANALIFLLNDGADRVAERDAGRHAASCSAISAARRCRSPKRIPAPASSSRSRRCRWC